MSVGTELFRACHAFTLTWEGDNCHQAAGESWFTCYGVAQRFNPNHDWPITRETALRIAYEKYWVPSGAEDMPDPLALVHHDFTFNAGGGAAGDALEESDSDYVTYSTLRGRFYTSAERRNRSLNLPGWINRTMACLDLAREWDRALPSGVSLIVDDRPLHTRVASALHGKLEGAQKFRELPWTNGRRKLHIDLQRG